MNLDIKLTAAPKFKEGDIIYSSKPDGVTVAKILRVDLIETSGANYGIYHLCSYQPVSEITADTVGTLQPRILHSPINVKSTDDTFTYLTNVEVTQADLRGFLVYLEMTDFPRFLEESGLNPREVRAKAVNAYNAGCILSDQGDQKRAIEKYSEAIEIWPSFFEALDNRGFAYMELGELEKALEDFDQSIRINNNSSTAIFSAGECHLKLGRPTAALHYFNECVRQWPEEQAFHQFKKDAEQMEQLQRQ